MSAAPALPTTIVIRLPNWVGDVCMVMPSLELLRQTGARLILCGKPFAQPLVCGLTGVTFVPVEGTAFRDARRLRDVLRQVDGSRTGLLFPDSLSSALTFWLAGLDSLGYRDDGRSLLLKWPIRKPRQPCHAVRKWYDLTRHAIERWQLQTVEPIPAQPAFYHLEPAPHDTELAQAALRSRQIRPHAFVLLAPTATGLHKGRVKVWPGFGELAQALAEKGYRVVCCPPEHERPQAARNAPAAELLEPLGLGAFAALAAQASLVVCNDSGVSHIAALVRARQITVFGVTDPALTGPWSDQARCIGQMSQWPSTQTVLQTCLAYLDRPGLRDDSGARP